MLIEVLGKFFESLTHYIQYFWERKDENKKKLPDQPSLGPQSGRQLADIFYLHSLGLNFESV